MKEIDEILATDMPEIQKLSRVFYWITNFYIESSNQEIEVLKALGDQEMLIREQIKQSVFKHALSIYQQSHLLVTKREAWDE